jgi:hypothetical protein
MAWLRPVAVWDVSLSWNDPVAKSRLYENNALTRCLAVKPLRTRPKGWAEKYKMSVLPSIPQSWIQIGFLRKGMGPHISSQHEWKRVLHCNAHMLRFTSILHIWVVFMFTFCT